MDDLLQSSSGDISLVDVVSVLPCWEVALELPRGELQVSNRHRQIGTICNLCSKTLLVVSRMHLQAWK